MYIFGKNVFNHILFLNGNVLFIFCLIHGAYLYFDEIIMKYIYYLYFACHKLMIVQIICAIICYSCFLIMFCFIQVHLEHWSSRFSLFSQMVFVSQLPNDNIINNYLYLNSRQNKMSEHLDPKLNLGQKWFSQNNPGPVRMSFCGELSKSLLNESRNCCYQQLHIASYFCCRLQW